MKKGIIVLLIAVLVAGFAFAGNKFNGSASISFGADLDTAKWGFKNATETKYSFTFDINSASAAKGEEADIWAELAATASASIAKGEDDAAAAIKTDVKISKANIHVKDITIGILDAGTGVNLAKAYYKGGDDKFVDAVAGGSKLAPGFTFAYKQFKGGFGAEGTKLDSYKIFAHAEIDDFKIADDKIGVSAGIYGLLTDVAADKVLGGSVKLAYAQDKLSADVAADLNFLGGKYEIAANAKYDFVTANVYAYIDGAVQLDAKLAAEYTVEDIKLKGSVDARNIIDAARTIEVALEETTTVDAFEIKLVENYKFADKTLGLKEEVTYKADSYKAYAKLGQKLVFGAEKVFDSFNVELGASSDLIVKGADLSLVYKNADVLTKKGAITAAAKIAF